MIPLRTFSDYFLENASIGLQTNQLQITSACNARCIFCSNEQNSFPIERNNFRDLEEIEKIIYSMDPKDKRPIHLNESLPGRISEGEALIHPRFFDILKAIRGKSQNVVGISTNGSLLDRDFVKELSKFNPIKIRVSYPSNNEKYWQETFRLQGKAYENATNSFELMTEYKIQPEASMVPMPSWVGYSDLDLTIRFLKEQGIQDLLIYAPGYTIYTKSEVTDKLRHSEEELSHFLDEKRKQYNLIIRWSLDPFLDLALDWSRLAAITSDLYRKKVKKVVWLTSIAAEERFRAGLPGVTRETPMDHKIIAVENKTYGGNIKCSGLWMLDDIATKIDSLEPSVIFSPRNFLDHYGFDLMGNNAVDFIKKYPQHILNF